MTSRNSNHFCGFPIDDGKTCRAYRLRDGQHCYVHDESTKDRNLQRLAEVGPKGGHRAQADRRRIRKKYLSKFHAPIREVMGLVPTIDSPEDLRRYLTFCLPLAARGDLGPNKDRAFLKTAELIVKTFELEASGFIPPPVLPDVDAYAGHERDGSSAGLDEMAGDHLGVPPTVELLSDLDLGDDDDEDSHRPDDTLHVLAKLDSELTPQPMKTGASSP